MELCGAGACLSAQGICSEQGTAATVEIWRPALHSPTACPTAVKGMAQHIMRDILIKAVAAQQGPFQQSAEQWDLAQSMAVAMI